MALFTFTNPLYLYLLALIPVVILAHFLTLKWKRNYALRFANFEAIAKVKGVDLISKNILILVVTILILTLMILSLAGMQIQRTIPTSSFSFGIAIDTSRSMEATDFSPNRLEAAKETAINFIDITPTGTKLVVISFSGNAFIEQAITADKLQAKQAIREIPLSSVGGTDLNEAVITATNLLGGEDAKSVILLSDGQINVGTIDDVIEYANDNSVIVHTFGIGTAEGGETSFGLSKLDEDSLKALAFNTDGTFFPVQSRAELQSSLNSVLQLENKKVFVDISTYLLVAALLLLTIEFILINTRYKVFP